jgi:crossover junction endodeoxyribonuclease RuvC
MARILGIDQSYTSSGLCLVDETGTLLEFERYKSYATMDTYARALAVALHICDYITKHKPTEIKLEGLAFGIRGNATRDLAGLIFTIINVVQMKHPGMKYKVVAPTSVKKKATGSGKAKKVDMIAALPEYIRTKFEESGVKKTTGLGDLADSYWISQT